MTKTFRYIVLLSLAGISIALYLLWQQSSRPAFQPCNINSFINCEAIISGEVAKTFGVPTPLYGLIGYSMILFAAITRRKKLMMAVSSFGLAFCMWIAYVELVELRVICPLCITCQAIMITIFILALSLIRNKDV